MSGGPCRGRSRERCARATTPYPRDKVDEMWEYTSHIMRKVADPAVAGDMDCNTRRKATPANPLARTANRAVPTGV